MATIAENLQTIQTIKNNIKTSIENKGVSVGDVSFTEYSTKIDEITTGGTGGGADGFDFSALGYNTTLNNACNDNIQEEIDYGVQVLNEWDSTITDASSYFEKNKKLVYCPNIDTSNLTNASFMFSQATLLTTIPQLDFSNVENAQNLFYRTSIKKLPILDFSRVENCRSMFNESHSLEEIPFDFTSENINNVVYMFQRTNIKNVPYVELINCTNVNYMFNECYNLESIPLLDFTNITSVTNFISSTGKLDNLTDLGGFKNFKVTMTLLKQCPNLTYQSVMNVINNLYDFVGNGSATTRSITFNTNINSLLSSADIAIATAKGWSLKFAAATES